MKIMVVKDRNVLNTKFLKQFTDCLTQQGFDVDVVCDSCTKQGNGVILNDKVHFYNLNALTKNPIGNLFRRLAEACNTGWLRYQKFIKRHQPDIIICYFIKDLFNVTRFQNHRIPIIMMMHEYPPSVFKKHRQKGFFHYRKVCKAFEHITAIQVLLPSFEAYLHTLFPNKVIKVIGNIVDRPETPADLNDEKKKIIYIARIEKNGKRQHLLLEAFTRIANDFPDWTLELRGLRKYPEYDSFLFKKACAAGLQNRVFVNDYDPDIFEIYKTADICAFPSRQEGFGLCLAEGMACGLPAVGFADSPGVNELIQDGRSGYLCTDIDDFANKLKTLISDKDLRLRLGLTARLQTEKYSAEKIGALWKKLIMQTINGASE